MNEKLTALEVIGMGIRSEEDAAKFYGHIAKMIQNKEIKEKYEQLAKEEVGHGIQLTTLYKEMLESDEKPPRVPGNPETAEKGAIPENIINDLEGLLNLAIEREQQAQAFYLKAAHQAVDPSGGHVLRELAHVEAEHEAMLIKELEEYLKNKEWYMNATDESFIHVGP
ncbi:MAG: ferritin family protein [bacterium]|nr:ferritin family protein [bacterium]MBU1918374.1 ferritin family protein [bacterium]